MYIAVAFHEFHLRLYRSKEMRKECVEEMESRRILRKIELTGKK